MKIGFMSSTCPNFTVDEVIALATKLGFTGYEPRVGWGHAHGIESSTPANQVRAYGRKLADAGICVPCVATSVRTALPAGAARQEQLDDVKRMVDLASQVGAPNIRVFGMGDKDLTNEERVDLCAQTLASAADIAQGSGVTLCLETHDLFRAGSLVGKAVDMVNRPEVQVLWDITHAVAVGEKVRQTAEYIKLERVRHCHVRDLYLTPSDEGFAQKPCHDFGTGDAAPYLKEAASLLNQVGFTGVFSLEVIFEPSDTTHDPVKYLTAVSKGMHSIFGE